MLQRTISMFAAIVVFFTTYALVLPAITMEKTAGCGIEEHQHDDSCYEDQLICGLEETEEHQHTADCYERVLVCGKEAHTHSAACYPADTYVEVDAGTDDNSDNTDDADTFVGTTNGGEITVPISDPSDGYGQASDDQPTDGLVTEDPAALTTDSTAAAYPAVIFDDAINVRSAGLTTDTEVGTDSGLQTVLDETSLFVHVEADEETFPEGTTMVLSEVTDDTIETVATAVEGALSAQDAAVNAQQAKDASQAQTRTRGFHALDISFYDLEGNKIEPLRPVRVSITSDAIRTAVQDETTVPVVVHVEDQTAQTAVSDNVDGAAAAAETAAAGPDTALNSTVVEAAETTEAAATGRQDEVADIEQTPDTLTFEAGAFSVYAIVYTVDFHWEVDGKSYDFSIPGGGYVSLYDLVKDLGIAEDKADTEKDEIRELVDGVERIEFSNPELVSVSKTEENTTVGAIKDGLGLECEYSADLTEKQIDEINTQEVLAGDWALISLKPFDTEESMTVTMINGETWTVKVTDAQIKAMYLTDSGKLYEVTVAYGEDAGIPDGSTLEIIEVEKTSAQYKDAYELVSRLKNSQKNNVDESVSENIGEVEQKKTDKKEDDNSDSVIIDTLTQIPVEMDVLDISIFDKKHESVEPKAPVKVSIIRKDLPEGIPASTLESTLAVNHLNDQTGEMTVETVVEADGEPTDGIDVEKESVQVEFFTDSFSTYTISWGGGLTGTGISSIPEGQYIIYAHDAANGNYYALLPKRNNNGTLNTVQLTNTNGVLSYTGDISNLYWTYSKYSYYYEDYYRFSFGSGNSRYYLTAGTFGQEVTTSQSGTSQYGYSNTTLFGQYNDHLHAARDTFLRCYNGIFQFVHDVSSGWEDRSQVFFAKASETKNVTVHYGYMDGNTFMELSNDNDGDVPAGTVILGPTQYGEQWDLEKTIPGYRYVTTRLNNPTNGREISSLLNTDPPYKANTNNTFENADQSAHPSYTSNTAPTSFVSEWRYRQLSSLSWNPTNDVGNIGNWGGTYTANNWEFGNVTGLGVTKPVSFGENDKDIYVIYEKGSMSGGSGDNDDTDLGELNAPKTDKQVQSNQDGTYDVTLSAKGEKRDSESSTKANVVVILDTSWSMYEKDAGGGKSRLAVAKSAIGSLADKLFALNAEESDTIELAFVTFAQRVRNEEEMRTIYSGTDAASFKNMINGLDCASGTNWDDALYAANHIYFDDNDPTYIVFVTDGDPISCAHPYGTYDDWDGGTYYNDKIRSKRQYALAAKNQADLIVGNNKTLYTIGAFGEISNLKAIGGTYLGQANDTTTINGYFDDIISDIQSALGYQDITINDGITALSSTGLARGDISSLRYYRSGGENTDGSEKYDHTANDGHGVEWDDAPDAYLLEVKSENGVTKYYKNGKVVSLGSLTDLTEPEYLEKYPVGTRTVIWDISSGSEELLEDGVTYTMIFTMWPSQEAYDLIADLNNKTIDYKDLSQAEKDQVYLGDDNVYYLKTNTKATVDYKSVKLVNGEVSGKPTSGSAPIEDPKGKMNLDTSVMTVRKDFAHLINEVDPYEEIVFYLLVDGKYYNKDGTLSDTLDESNVYAMNLPKDGKWEDTIYIAPGLMRGGEILETGHNYSLEEKIVSGNPYEYEFAPQTVRPMVITAVPTFLVKKDTFNTNQESKKEYTFNDADSLYTEVNGKSDAEGTYYVASENNGTLVGVNHKTSELDITKIIHDPNDLLTPAQEASDTFTYRVTLQIPDGCDPSGIVGYEYVPRTQSNAFTLFGYQTGQSAFAEDIARFNGKTYRAWNTLVYDALIQYDRVTENGKTVIKAKRDDDGNIIWNVPAENGYHTIIYDMTLKQDEVIRFTNLPTGTKYKVQEIYANKYPADNAGGKTDGRAPVTDAGNLTAEGYEVEKVQHTGGTLSTDKTTVEGTIEAPDTRYYNQFTNKKVTEDKTTRVELKVKKEVEDYTWGEEYYRFTLAAGTATYTDSTGGSGKAPMPDGEQNSAVSIYDTTPDHTLSFGMIRYSRPGTYTYTVTEYDNSKNMPYVQFAAPVNLTVTVTADNTGKLTVTKVEDDKGTTVYSAENGFVIASGLTTQTNTSKKIYLKKVDKNNPEKVLSDALFEIKSGRQKMYLQNGRLLSAEDVAKIIEMSVSAESADKAMEEAGITSALTLGEIGISGFVYDTVYELKELSAPDGYVITSGSVYFKAVREDAQVYMRLTDQNGNILVDEKHEPVLDNDSARVSENGLSIAIKNEPGAALPNTGGPGTRLFTILGTALIAGAGLLLWMTRKSADFAK